VRQMMSNGGLARNLTEMEAVAGSWRYITEHRRKVAQVNPQDIMRVARKYFVKENRIVGTLVRREEQK
ncbi:MAG TPA: insulinase family protein, partial [Verrucomicrobiae bacterium]|nr:insulinase family protein [Verrucomicrobiae bacterium]